MRYIEKILEFFVITAFVVLAGCNIMSSGKSGDRADAKKVINLDGTWEITEGSMESIPEEFTARVPVPGLVNMAEPAFAEVGTKSKKREAFWYRRKFKVNSNIPDVAILKVHKVRYGTKVYLNGELVGEHLPCFTPAYMNVKGRLKGVGQENELIVRVGADHESLPEGILSGGDFEGDSYIPGIFDSVEVILADRPLLQSEAVFAKSVKVSVVCLRYNPPEMYNCCDVERNLTTVCERLDQAAEDGADLVLLPMECVKTPGESIPGPISNAIAQKALEHQMYIIGNIREADGGKTYVTSFLCDRSSNIIGKYRKSHKMPDETMDLGDELPVFQTDFGKIAMRIGSDRFFVDIDHVYTAKGAAMICWSQMPEPFEDEYQQDMPSIGRAADYNVFIACARYSTGRRDVYRPNWVNVQGFYGMSLGKSYVVNREGMYIACTPRMGSSVATATIPSDQLSHRGRGIAQRPVYPDIWAPVKPLNKPEYKKRTIVVTAIPDRLKPDEVLTKIDEAGAIGSDIVLPDEVEWCKSPNDHEDFLNSLAEKAAQYQMYILMCGILRNPDINEGLLYDRNGQLVFTYTKICASSRLPGNDTPVYDTDFGRIGVRICCDEQWPEIDRSYFIKGAELLFYPTLSWEPDGITRNERDFARALDHQMFEIQTTQQHSEFVHRSFILESTGIPIVQNRYSHRGDIVSAVIDLDNDRPRRYVRQYSKRRPGGYMPKYKPDFVPGMQNDLADIIRQQRRPELYISLWPAGYQPPRLASNPTPANDTKEIVTNLSLSWTEGWFARSHDIYFGTSFDEIDQANDPNTPPGRGNQTSTTYNPGKLQAGRTYFWRIDEICPVPTLGTWKGKVWSFTVNDSSSSASSVGPANSLSYSQTISGGENHMLVVGVTAEDESAFKRKNLIGESKKDAL